MNKTIKLTIYKGLCNIYDYRFAILAMIILGGLFMIGVLGYMWRMDQIYGSGF